MLLALAIVWEAVSSRIVSGRRNGTLSGARRAVCIRKSGIIGWSLIYRCIGVLGSKYFTIPC